MTKPNRYGENEDQGEYWNELSGPKWVEEDEAMNTRLALITKGLFKTAALTKNQNVLDVGCGGGGTTEIAAKNVGSDGKVDGLDISVPLLALAKKKCSYLEHVSFNFGDAQTYPLPVRQYDQIISRFGVMFFENPVKAFTNLHTSLANEGKFTFVCWSSIDENEFFHIPLDTVTAHLKIRRPEVTTAPGPLSLSQTAHTKNILLRAGFSNVQIKTVKTKMSSPDSVVKHAKLYLKIGPGAKLIGENNVGEDVFQSIFESLTKKLENHRDGNNISLEATVHYVVATK